MPRPPTDPDWRCARCLRQRPYVRRHGVRPTCDRCNGELRAKGLKWCAGCAKARPLAEFGPHKGRCRPCVQLQGREVDRVYKARWRERHRERHLAVQRAYRERKVAALGPEWERHRYRLTRARRARRFIQHLRGEQP